MSFALAFIGAALAVLWLPWAVLIWFAVYGTLWAVGLVGACAVFAAVHWAATWSVGRLPSRWGTMRRAAAAVVMGLALGVVMVAALVVYSRLIEG